MKALLSPEQPAGDVCCWDVQVLFPAAHGTLPSFALSCCSVPGVGAGISGQGCAGALLALPGSDSSALLLPMAFPFLTLRE